jgi:hypothetical protein
VGFEIFQIPLESALGRDLVAGEIAQESLMGIGPMIGVHGQLPFDLSKAFLRALQEPMRFGELFD